MKPHLYLGKWMFHRLNGYVSIDCSIDIIQKLLIIPKPD